MAYLIISFILGSIIGFIIGHRNGQKNIFDEFEAKKITSIKNIQ